MPKHIDRYNIYDELPFGCIRLLKILTADNPALSGPNFIEELENQLEDQINIEIETFELASCPPFTALSYTWGLPGTDADPLHSVFTQVQRCFPIICNGAILLGTYNLRAAMRRIRQAVGVAKVQLSAAGQSMDKGILRTYDLLADTKYYWVDALCIDQNNLQEKSHQVKDMGEIYKLARMTIIWLGDRDSNSQLGFKVLSRIWGKTQKAFDEATRQHRDVTVDPIRLPPDELNAAIAILNRAWFSRLWVVQEVLLSKDLHVLLGTTLSSFDIYQDSVLLNQLSSFTLPTVDQYPVPQHIRDQVYRNIYFLGATRDFKDQIKEGRLPDFMDIVNLCNQQECSDPRDKIYGILGITSEFNLDVRNRIEPSYDKPFEKVFTEATAFLVRSRSDLAVLNFAWARGPCLNSLPSWVPDYRISVNALSGIRGNQAPWRLNHSQKTNILTSEAELQVCGERLAIIQETAGLNAAAWKRDCIESDNFGISAVLSLLTRVETSCRENIPKGQTLGRLELFWRTVIGKFVNCIKSLAGWYENDLPNGVGLFLPTFVRMTIFVWLRYERQKANTWQWARVADEPPKLREYMRELKNIIVALVDLEPDEAHLLPEPAEFDKLASSQDDEEALMHLMAINTEAHGQMEERARKLNLDLPEGFTRVTSPLMPRCGSFASSHAFDWLMGFVNALGILGKASIFRTDNHLIGFAKGSVRHKDEIWILDGAYAPVCLRPMPNGGFECQGVVYMHELMDPKLASNFLDPRSIVLQ